MNDLKVIIGMLIGELELRKVEVENLESEKNKLFLIILEFI